MTTSSGSSATGFARSSTKQKDGCISFERSIITRFVMMNILSSITIRSRLAPPRT